MSNLILFLFCIPAGDATAPSLGQVKRGDFAQRVTIAGTVIPNRKTLITAPYSGYVKKIYVRVGDEINQGDPVVSIAQTLQSTDTVYPLRAPFPGTVVHIEKSEGEYVKEGELKDFILRIDDLSKFYILSYAPEIDRAKIKKGQDAVIKASAILHRTYTGIIRDLSLAAREKENRATPVEFPVKTEVINPDQNLRPGMSVVLDINVQKKKNILMLKHEFLHREDDDFYVIMKDGKRRDVEVGLQNEDVLKS